MQQQRCQHGWLALMSTIMFSLTLRLMLLLSLSLCLTVPQTCGLHLWWHILYGTLLPEDCQYLYIVTRCWCCATITSGRLCSTLHHHSPSFQKVWFASASEILPFWMVCASWWHCALKGRCCGPTSPGMQVCVWCIQRCYVCLLLPQRHMHREKAWKNNTLPHHSSLIWKVCIDIGGSPLHPKGCGHYAAPCTLPLPGILLTLHVHWQTGHDIVQPLVHHLPLHLEGVWRHRVGSSMIFCL